MKTIAIACSVAAIALASLAPKQVKKRRAPAPEKIGCIRKDSLAFLQKLRRLFIQCKDLKTLTISTPSLRLDGKASGQTLTEIGRI